MPTYEFVCSECGTRAEGSATVAEKEKGLHLTCPECRSPNMRRVFSRFLVLGSSGQGKGGGSCGCGPQAGPNCCG
ncbi:MAG: FmdB family zinc ribbon protein [Ignavibacteriales bacterium]